MNTRYRVAIGPSLFAAQDETPKRMLEEAGVEIVPNPFGRRLTEAEIIRQLDGVDGLIAGLEPLNRRVLSTAPQLKAIARVGIGMDNIDFEAVDEFGIRVSNTPEGPTQAVAEMTLTALLALGRGLLPANAALHEGKWRKQVGFGLRGTRILLIGYGRIGRRAGRLLQTLGAEVFITDPFVDKEDVGAGMRKVSLEEGLRTAEVVSLHASGGQCILGPDEFALMRDGVVLLNSARGGLVDKDALIEALDSRKVSSAWFDAFWEEPYQGRLTEYEQVLLTPHLGTYTRQCRLSMEVGAVENLLRDLGILA